MAVVFVLRPRLSVHIIVGINSQITRVAAALVSVNDPAYFQILRTEKNLILGQKSRGMLLGTVGVVSAIFNISVKKNIIGGDHGNTSGDSPLYVSASIVVENRAGR